MVKWREGGREGGRENHGSSDIRDESEVYTCTYEMEKKKDESIYNYVYTFTFNVREKLCK